MFMVAIEATIIATAMPQIVADLGGLALYSWVFSSFLLAQTAMTVVFGNLADIYGRKPVMLVGIAIFLVGSTLAGFATTMPTMILDRVIQGAGAGAIQTVALTVVADLYPARERGKIQGYLASVWAISAVLGPIVGSLIVRQWSWAWVFWINIPVGILAAAGFIAFLQETKRHEGRSIDLAGAACFTIAVTALLIALTEIGSAAPATLAGIGAVFCAAALGFVLQERRTAHPMISFAMWSLRPVAATNGVAVLSSMALMGLTTFVPIYVQLVLRRPPVVAGLALTTMLVGWPIGATLAARSFHRFALRRILITGTVLLPVGATMFVVLTPASSPGLAGLGSLIMGFGMGLSSVSSLVLIQEVVEPHQRGSVTASTLFARNIGSTMGATVLAAVLNHGLAHALAGNQITAEQLRQMLNTLPSVVSQEAAIRLGLQHALNLTFWAMLGLSLATVVISLWIPSVGIARADAVPAQTSH